VNRRDILACFDGGLFIFFDRRTTGRIVSRASRASTMRIRRKGPARISEGAWQSRGLGDAEMCFVNTIFRWVPHNQESRRDTACFYRLVLRKKESEDRTMLPLPSIVQ